MPKRSLKHSPGKSKNRQDDPRQVQKLARDLHISDDQLDEFRRSVGTMAEDGQVLLGASQTGALPPPGREMVGMFRLTERGFGFIVPDSPTEHGDLFVPSGNTAGAMTGDHVRAKVIHEIRRAARGRSPRSPYIGRIIEILQRADRKYVGNLFKRGNLHLVQVDGRLLHDPVVIRDPGAKHAKEGDKVVVELIDYPEGRQLSEGVITEVLGEQGEPEVETRAIMRAYGLAEKFPPQVLDDARAASRAFDHKHIPPDREDLTGQYLLTIDPSDAKDFDDAISITRLEDNGHDAAYELGVHIADVAHFVKAGAGLDTEARARGNSVYLPRRVVPMLPELLSNGVCSLQEGVNRFSRSAFIRYDAGGNVVSRRFARTVIRSAKRLSYLEAQALIDGDLREARKHACTAPKYGGPLVKTLQLMDELAKIIYHRRVANGQINLDLPEVELVYDDTGRVVDAEPGDNAFTHTIIEMFMVEANEAVARLFDSLGVPMIRRIHPDPDAQDVTELRQFARVAGYNIPTRPSRAELQALLDAVRGKPAQYAVHLAVLKTLSKAEYSPARIGHFALASDHYTHFTSPIRRYPDMVVHRAIDAYLELTANGRETGGRRKNQLARKLAADPRCPDEQTLVEIGRHCSATERNAESAERELRNYLVLELMTEHLGEDFDGTVTGVTGSGIFVQIDRYLVDGFVRCGDLPGTGGERWKINERTRALVAQRSRRSITIGDRYTVRIVKVDPARRQMDLAIIDKRPGKTAKRRQPAGARRAHQQTMKLKQAKAHQAKGRNAKKARSKKGRRRR